MSQDYKATINLPKTAFSMKANLANREPQMLAAWEKEGRYQKIMKATADRPHFVLHDGPPYANGNIHIGHAVNKVLKDLVIKSKLLGGFHTPYVPGWDCHGLPIELKVEKKVGKVGHKVDAATFRDKCRAYAIRQIDIQRDQFMRLGGLGDWENPYRTLDQKYEADIVRALARIVERGHLHQGVKPVHWCFDCGSALAEAEIEYQDKVSPAIDVAFKAVDSSAVAAKFGYSRVDERPVELVIWTTTPWTLPANQAVALHPDLEYSLVDANDRLVILGSDLVASAAARYGWDSTRVVGTTTGAELELLKFSHPFYDRKVPVILGDHVTVEAGTGCVHTAPGHGQEDFEVGAKYDLPILNPVGPRGLFNEEAPLFEGQRVWAANLAIIELLKTNGALLHDEEFEHSYPHCWRHKSPTAFRVTPQWFIHMDKNGLRQAAIDAIGDVRWVPGWGEQRIHSMIENRPDWCISRQRTWGVPIAIFAHAITGEPHPDTARLMSQAADLIEEQGINAWYELDPADFLGADAEEYEKVTDILDVWFDSGVTHHCVLAQRDELSEPADMYLEGSDQHRGWFQSSLLTSMAMHGRAPYRQVMTHGFTVDADGRKMSKSMGNVVAPQEVINKSGADVLRWWVAASDYRYEMSVSDEILKRVSDAYRRVRNTCRFLLGNIHDLDVGSDLIEMADMLPLDQWAMATAHGAQQEIIAAFDNYQFHQVQKRILQFCSVEMGAFYLDVIKDRLYTTPPGSHARRSAQSAMYHIVEALVRWIAPSLSFTAEEIWSQLPATGAAESRPESVFMGTWYEGLSAMPEESRLSSALFGKLAATGQIVRRQLEVLRREGAIGSALAADAVVYVPDSMLADFEGVENELRFLFITSGASVRPIAEAPESATRGEVGDEVIQVTVSANHDPKCTRCWHQRPEVGSFDKHPELCGRCLVNVEGVGETRYFF